MAEIGGVDEDLIAKIQHDAKMLGQVMRIIEDKYGFVPEYEDFDSFTCDRYEAISQRLHKGLYEDREFMLEMIKFFEDYMRNNNVKPK